MNPQEQITPEEKLLKLIRRGERKTPKPKSATPSLSSQDQAITQAKPAKPPAAKPTKILFSGIKALDFISINRVILGLALVVCVVLFIDLFSQSSIKQKLPSAAVAPKEVSLEEQKDKPYSYYEEDISGRQLFNVAPVESRVQKVIPAGPTFQELIKSLKLIGIVSGDNPRVIIEDTRLNKTYFLYKGDYLDEIRLEEVYADRVVLEFKGERISLFL